jgi:hypothetical protein
MSNEDFTVRIGSNTRITTDILRRMMLYVGSGSASDHGPTKNALVCFNLPLVPLVFLSMVSRIYKALMVPESSQLRRVVILPCCQRVTHVSIEYGFYAAYDELVLIGLF